MNIIYEYKLNFELNEYQKKCSEQIVKYYLEHKNILLDAVCGAGKTEMLLEVCKIALNQNKKIGFACPRKQLTNELYERIKDYFQDENIGIVVGGKSKNNTSNFIFLTTHQLYKYHHYFDLLIIDEIDAFPFYNNFDLEQDALKSSKQLIFLSATVPKKYFELVKLNKLSYVFNPKRHHLKQMPGIKIVKNNQGILFIKLYIYIQRNIIINKKPLLIFISSIKKGKKLNKILNVLGVKNKLVYGCKKNIEIILKDFKSGKFPVLISTTVLERGITLKKLNVIVYHADNFIFNKDNLLQICGRVGRDTIYNNGDILFYVQNITKEISEVIKQIKYYNEL